MSATKTAADYHAEADRILAGIDLQRAAATPHLDHKWLLIKLLAHIGGDAGMQEYAETALTEIAAMQSLAT